MIINAWTSLYGMLVVKIKSESYRNINIKIRIASNEELKKMLAKEKFKYYFILIMANKQDLNGWLGSQ